MNKQKLFLLGNISMYKSEVKATYISASDTSDEEKHSGDIF